MIPAHKLATGRKKCGQRLRKDQPCGTNNGLPQTISTIVGDNSLGGLKHRLEDGKMLNFPKAKHVKDIALARVIPRESFAKNSLVELFHVGVPGPIMNRRHKRMIRSGMSGKRALRQKKHLEVEEVTESQTAVKAGLSIPQPFL